MPKFRFKRHGLLLVGGLALAGAVWFFCFPVPIGWAVRMGLKRALPEGSPLSVQLDGATLRWRLGEPNLRVDLGKMVVKQNGELPAELGGATVDASKAGLRSGQYAPALIELVQPRVVADLRAAKPAPASAPAKSANPPGTFGPVVTREQLAPLAALLPAAGQPSVIRADGLRVAIRNAAGTAEWEFGKIETRALREDKTVRVEFDAALSGAAPTLAVSVRASLGVEDGRARVALRVPTFNTGKLPSWPGAPAMPLQAAAEAEVTAEVDLAKGKVLSVDGSLLVADGELAVPDLAKPVAVKRVEFKGKATGEPLQFTLETGRVEMAGATVEIADVRGTIGERSKFSGRATVRDARAAEWIALLPPEVRRQLPVREEAVAGLAIERATFAGTSELVANPLGGWLPDAVDMKGEIVAANEGRPLQIKWTAQQPPGGTREVKAELTPFVPAEWGGKLFENLPMGMLRLPISGSATATLDANAIIQNATMELRAGAGTLTPWGPLTRALPVRGLTATARIEEGGKLLRVPSLRLELDGPVMSLDKLAVTLPEGDGPMEASGGVRVEKMTAEWAEAWLPPDALAPLKDFGLKPSELQVETLAGDMKLRAQPVDGTPKLLEGQATLELGLRMQEMPLTVHGQAKFLPATQRVEATFHVAKFEPARLRVKLPERAPPLSALDFPVALRGKASVGLDGKRGDMEFALNVGPGRLRAFAPLNVEVPVKEFSVEGSASPDFSNLTARTLTAEIGAGLKLHGRELNWQAGAAPKATGEIAVDAVKLPDLFPLLPADAQKTAREILQAAGLKGARVQFAATAAPKEPVGWHVDRLTGQVGVEQVRASTPEAGAVAIEQADVELDYPRATVRLANATAAKFFNGPVSLTAKVDTANREALSAELTIDGAQARLLEKQWEKIALVGKPLRVAATLKGTEAVQFHAETDDLLGRKLLLDGTARQPAKGFLEAELARVEFGRTAVGLTLKQSAPDRYTVKVAGARLDVDELVRTSTPFFAGLEMPAPIAANPAAKTAGIPLTPLPAPATPPTLEFAVALGAVDFGDGRTVSDFKADGLLDRGWPNGVTVTGREGAANTLRAELGAGAVTQNVRLEIADASAWLTTVTRPLQEAKLPPGPLAASAAQLVKIPSLVAGGKVSLSGELTARDRFAGNLKLEKATVVRAPRVLQLLALKSGKALAQQPLIDSLVIDRVGLDQKGISVEGLTFAGTGLIDRLQVKSASYALNTEKLAMDGIYFGVGFEIVGTRADPQIFLKDNNLLIRAVGQRNEFDFEAMEADEKAKEASKKK